MKNVILALSAITSLAAVPAIAEEVAMPVAPVAVAAAMPPSLVLPKFEVAHHLVPAGTELSFVVKQLLTTVDKKAIPGQAVELAVASDVVVDGITVIPAGTKAKGEVLQVAYHGSGGKAGLIAAQLVSMELAGREVPISGKFGDNGKAQTTGANALSVLIPFGGVLVKGGKAEIPVGFAVPGKLLVDIDIIEGTARALPVTVPLAALATR